MGDISCSVCELTATCICVLPAKNLPFNWHMTSINTCPVLLGVSYLFQPAFLALMHHALISDVVAKLPLARQTRNRPHGLETRSSWDSATPLLIPDPQVIPSQKPSRMLLWLPRSLFGTSAAFCHSRRLLQSALFLVLLISASESVISQSILIPSKYLPSNVTCVDLMAVLVGWLLVITA